MPKIEGVKGICRLCFDPVWEDQNFVMSNSKFYYHNSCADKVKNLDDWEKKHSNPRRDLEDTKQQNN